MPTEPVPGGSARPAEPERPLVVSKLDPGEPATPRKPVSPVLCNVDDKAVFDGEHIHFATNRAVIRPRSFPLLNRIAKATRMCPRAKLRIAGHTDDRGHRNFNLRLSRARAAAVRDYIVSAGGEAGDIAVTGFGETRPIASNDSRLGRARNRRIEIDVIR